MLSQCPDTYGATDSYSLKLAILPILSALAVQRFVHDSLVSADGPLPRLGSILVCAGDYNHAAPEITTTVRLPVATTSRMFPCAKMKPRPSDPDTADVAHL